MPIEGEIRKDYELGLGNKYVKLVCLSCLACGKQRWVRVSDMRQPNYTGLCQPCCLQRRNGKQDKSPKWKGGVKHCGGKVLIWLPVDHPFHLMVDKLGYVERSRLIMAQRLGRPLTPNEIVHHRNEIKDDDRFENLRLFASNSKHISHHRQMEIRKNGNRPRDTLGRFLKGAK